MKKKKTAFISMLNLRKETVLTVRMRIDQRCSTKHTRVRLEQRLLVPWRLFAIRVSPPRYLGGAHNVEEAFLKPTRLLVTHSAMAKK